MRPKAKRIWYLSLLFSAALGITTIVLVTLQDHLLFFVTPLDIKDSKIKTGQKVRLGGMVTKGSIHKEGVKMTFIATDYAHNLPVVFEGVVPDLFQEGQGFVAEGVLRPDGVFTAEMILAKHDENYMPREVKDKLKAKMEWQQ